MSDDGTPMTEVYENGMRALEAIAEHEAKKQTEPKVSFEMSLNCAISVWLVVGLKIKECEDRINSDLRRDRRIPTDLERQELSVYREAFEIIGKFMRGNP